MTFRPSRFMPEAQLLPPSSDGNDLLSIMNTSGPPGAETKPKSWRKPIALGGKISPPGENHEISHPRYLHSARNLEPPGDWSVHDVFFRDTRTREQSPPPIGEGASDPPSRGSPAELSPQGFLCAARSLEPPGDWSDHDVFFRDTRTRRQSPPPIREGASEPPSRGSPAELSPQGFLCSARSLEPPGDWSDHDVFFRDKRTREQSPSAIRAGASEPPFRGLTMKVLTRKNLHPERSLEPPGLKRFLMTGGSPPEVRSNLPEILQTSSISQPLESFYT
jgi:hypothetical protein